MRQAFVQTLIELAHQDERILLLTGDLGYMVLEPFMEAFPQRFFNVGVAEQNMVGVATGLAEAGFLPFVYSIAPFATLRAYEFIRNGPVLHQFPVRIVGVGGGFEYGYNGASHYGLEDVGVMQLQPGLAVITPADYEQTRQALYATWDLPGPVYYRIGKDDKTLVPGLAGRFELGQVQTIREGTDLVLIAMGAIAGEVMAAAEILARQQIDCAVIVIASVSPAPIADLIDILSRFPLTVTAEAHYLGGGIGSLVCEIVAEHDLNCRVYRCGIKTAPSGSIGDQHDLARRHGLSSDGLVNAVVHARSC